jgi:hypothetical protein
MKPEMNPVTRNLQKTGRKAAIDAMCAYCMGCTSSLQGNRFTDHLEAGFRTAIRDCSAPHCPLFPWRPFQGREG